MRQDFKWISTAALAAALALAAAAQSNSGQSSSQTQANQNQNMSSGPVSSSTNSSNSRNGQYQVGNRGVSEAGEQRLVKEIRHELLMLPYYSVFDDLEYQVNGNNVTLLGKVVNATLKKDAENVVKHIEGVENVDNRIDILPPSPMDDQIRRRAYRAIYGYDGLFKYADGAVPPIHIIVQNGRITLTGVVDNEQDKNLAYIRASGIPNVFQVTNNLQVVKG